MTGFDLREFQPEVRALLELEEGGERLMGLVCRPAANWGAVARLGQDAAGRLFPGARAGGAALAGLYLYFGDYERSHTTAQEIHTREGSYWHGMVHRQEPDDWNSGYWMRQVGRHAVHGALAAGAAELAAARPGAGYRGGAQWDAEGFIRYCAAARAKAGGEAEMLAREIQRLEWQLLFRWCAAGEKMGGE